MSGNKGLSILIPIYNYHVRSLVEELKSQAKLLDIPFEIRCYDDLSSAAFRKANKSIAKIEEVTYTELPYNLGRSKIRNKMAEEAQFDSLLFIDCDSKINQDQYIQQYLVKAFTHDVVFGGTEYAEELVDPTHSLRWKYGRKREVRDADTRSQAPYESITFNNIFINKSVFLNNKLDENITSYGHEDTKFGFELKQHNIQIAHINNPVEHIGLEPNEAYLDKTVEGVKNLYKIAHEFEVIETKLLKTFSLIKRLSLSSLFRMSYNIFKNRIEKNLQSNNPKLFYFDMFKLNLILVEDSKAGKKLKY